MYVEIMGIEIHDRSSNLPLVSSAEFQACQVVGRGGSVGKVIKQKAPAYDAADERTLIRS